MHDVNKNREEVIELIFLVVRNGMGELITPFIKEEIKEIISSNVSNEKQLLEETFLFVESIDLQDTSVARIWNVSDRQF